MNRTTILQTIIRYRFPLLIFMSLLSAYLELRGLRQEIKLQLDPELLSKELMDHPFADLSNAIYFIFYIAFTGMNLISHAAVVSWVLLKWKLLEVVAVLGSAVGIALRSLNIFFECLGALLYISDSRSVIDFSHPRQWEALVTTSENFLQIALAMAFFLLYREDLRFFAAPKTAPLPSARENPQS